MSPSLLTPAVFRRLITRAVAVPPLLLGVLALVFLGQIVYLLWAAARVDHTDRVIARSNGLLKLLVDGETGVRGYLLTGDPAFLEPYLVEEAWAASAIEELAGLVTDDTAQAERLRTLRADHAEWRDFARGLIELRRTAGAYLTPVQNQEDKRRMDAMRRQIDVFIRTEEGLREDRSRTAWSATWVVGGTSLGAALLIGGVLAQLTRRQLLHVSESYGLALAAAEARAEAQRKLAHRLETLHEIDRAILAAVPLPDLTRAALDRAGQVVSAADSVVILLDPDGRPSQVISPSGPGSGASLLEGVEPAEVSGPSGGRWIPDLAAVARSPLQDRLFRAGHRSYMKAPLEADGERYGVLILADPAPGALCDEHREVAVEIANQLAIAARQAR
ncbi:MAG TPA: CHASE3 domain-containing protein, partial [Urbifossiella sp.]|nr:CHASE3 domain-containing protein [Urbifossiella sp.]